jgi:hypothetical protein
MNGERNVQASLFVKTNMSKEQRCAQGGDRDAHAGQNWAGQPVYL